MVRAEQDPGLQREELRRVVDGVRQLGGPADQQPGWHDLGSEVRHTPRLRGLRSATPSPLQGAPPAAWQSQFRGVCWKGCELQNFC